MCRLTDLAQRKLTAIYGEDDSATLQNVLNNVPNIVPHLLNMASGNSDNNNMADSGIVMPVVDHLSSQIITEDRAQHVVDSGNVIPVVDHSSSQIITEDRAQHVVDSGDVIPVVDHSSSQSISEDHGSNSVTAVVSVHADKDGAYVNPVVTENSPDNTRVVGNSKSTTSRSGRQLVRQHRTISEEDCQCVKNLDDDVLDHDKASVPESPQRESLSSSQEDVLNNSTLHTFLRMVSTQSIDVAEQLESTDAPDHEQPQAQVIYLTFLFQKLGSPAVFAIGCVELVDDSSFAKT